MPASYILADDLSGALEAGGAFRNAGWRVAVPLGEPSIEDEGILTVISTETRTADATQAAAAVRRVLDHAKARKARLVFKKIDSTFRGPIGAELSALMAELAPRLVVVCIANPDTGRTVVNGILHVNGMRSEHTEFRNEQGPQSEGGEIWARLSAQGVAVQGHIPPIPREGVVRTMRHLMDQHEGRHATVVLTCDAQTMDDIRVVVSAAYAIDPDVVMVGSAAVATALVERIPPRVPPPMSELPELRSMVVLCGSRHPASHGQLEILERDEDAVILDASREASRADLLTKVTTALDCSRLVAIKYDPAKSIVSSSSVVKGLADLAAEIAAAPGRHAFYLTGGETAFAVCHRLGGTRLEILRVLEAGVVLARLIREPRVSIFLISKPGGYGDARAMARHYRDMCGTT